MNLKYINTMNDTRCTIVTSSGGDRWIHLPQSSRVFYNYADFDGNPTGWGEAQCSWLSMTRHMYYAISEETDQPIPADLRKLIRLQRQGKLPPPAREGKLR